jgi:hypothetical protein
VQSVVDVQVFAHVPLQSKTVPDGHGSAHMPPAQRPLQQSVLPVQVVPIDPHVGGASAQVPLELSQFLLQHTLSFVQCFPLRLQPGGSAAASPMPSDASVPPTRAAPISLSALPRERVPLAIPLASSSKELSLVSLAIGCLLQRTGLVSPAVLRNVVKYEGLQDLAQLPRILIPRTRVNKGKKKGRSHTGPRP